MKKAANTDIEKLCKFCERAQELAGGETMLCPRYGVVSAEHICRRFLYDPLKRCPARPVKPVGIELDVPPDEDGTDKAESAGGEDEKPEAGKPDGKATE